MMTTMTRQISIDGISGNIEKSIKMNIEMNSKPKRSKKRPPVFPARLYDLLENAENEGYDHLIRWTPDGQSFKIHDNGKDKAIVAILKRNFNQTRFKSFLRQLQLYGFERRFKGQSRGECSHPMFVRGRKDLLYKKSIEEFQDAANDTAAKPTSCPSSTPAPDESSSSSYVPVPAPATAAAAAAVATAELVTSSHRHTVSDTSFSTLSSTPPPPTLARVVTDQQQSSSFIDVPKCNYFRNSSIPTRLVNLVLRDGEEDYADDDASDSINVFNRNLFDTDDDDEKDINAVARHAITTTLIHGDYPEWTGSSIELKILQKL
jgi:hypothetical protein